MWGPWLCRPIRYHKNTRKPSDLNLVKALRIEARKGGECIEMQVRPSVSENLNSYCPRVKLPGETSLILSHRRWREQIYGRGFKQRCTIIKKRWPPWSLSVSWQTAGAFISCDILSWSDVWSKNEVLSVRTKTKFVLWFEITTGRPLTPVDLRSWWLSYCSLWLES